MDDLLRPVGQRKSQGCAGKFTVDVIENFRKALPDTFVLENFRTSCDIGLRPGQTWIIFARIVNGYATVFACDYSVQCRGERPVDDYEYLQRPTAEELINTIRQFTGRTGVAAGGQLEKHYANGQRALLTLYRSNGVVERTAWYANGRLQGREFYRNGLKNGPSTWWNANGTPLSARTFLAGVAVDTSRRWHNTNTDTLWLRSTPSLTEQARDSLVQFNKRSHIQSITIADRRGQVLNNREYDWYGRLVDETIVVPQTGVACRTSYDRQGNVNFLIVTRAVLTPGQEPIQLPVYRIEYAKDNSRQMTYYDQKGRQTRWVLVKNGVETVLEEKQYPD